MDFHISINDLSEAYDISYTSIVLQLPLYKCTMYGTSYMLADGYQLIMEIK